MDELKKLKEKIRLATHEKNKYLTVFESLPNPVILADERNRFEYMNHAAALLFANNPSCGAGNLYRADDGMDILQPSAPAGSVESCLPWLDEEIAAFAGGPQLTCSFEKTFLAETGSRSFAVRFSRLQDISTTFLGTVIILEDITEKKQAEDALRLSEERFRSIFESATDSIIVWDKDHNYLYANQAAIDQVGAARDKLIGRNIRDGLAHLPELMRLWMERVDRVFDSGRPMQVEDAVEVGTKFVYSESVLSPIKDASGKMFAVGVLYRDVTERKEMENRLRQQNLALEDSNQELERANRQILEQQKSIIEEERLKVLLQMAGATAHELNQPLMALLGYIELMAMDRNNPEKVGKYSDQIEDAGRRIAEIVRKIQTIRHDEVKHYAGETTILNLDKPIDILSVEDNDLDYQRIKATLDQPKQVRIERAEDIDIGFERLAEKSFDLIFVDYALPSGTALDFIAKMEDEHLEIPVVVITGKGDEMIASQVIQSGAYDYLPKSKISKKSLARIIHHSLEKFRMKTEIKQAMEKMAELSTKDELTGLYNRRYFMEFSEREVAGAARYEQDLSLLMLDLDFFKQINDTHGHPAGDAVLKQTARLLKTSIRNYDAACRYGGEEFAVIMPNTCLTDARIFCERVRKKIEASTVRYDSKKIRFTVSIGLAQFVPEIDKSIAHLIKRADDGLYAAKQQGRNRVIALDDQVLPAAAGGP
jgi:two-component system cell cycle response regulator